MSDFYFNQLARFQNLQAAFENQGRIIENYDFGGFLLGNPRPASGRDIDLLILALVHGNEPGSLLPINQLLEEYLSTQSPAGQIGILLCHPDAAARGVRFLERDLNRSFGIKDHTSLERKRAIEIEKLILRSKFLIDLHQTNYETKSDFFIFPDTPANIAFASQICDQTPIITHGLDFSDDGFTSDTFATMNKVTAITYEMGQIGRSEEQSKKTLRILKQAIDLSCHGLEAYRPRGHILRFGQRITSSSQKRLIPNLINLDLIKKGEVLAHDENGPILAEHDGYVLFPKYDPHAQTSSELCHLVTVVPAD